MADEVECCLCEKPASQWEPGVSLFLREQGYDTGDEWICPPCTQAHLPELNLQIKNKEVTFAYISAEIVLPRE